MDNFSIPSGSLPPIPPSVGDNNAVVAPPIIQPQSSLPVATPTTAPTTPPSTSSPAPSVPVAKILLAVIPFFAFIATAAISYRLMNQPQPVKYLSRAAETEQTASLNLETAKKVMGWIDQQKNADGIYTDNPFCLKFETCDNTPLPNPKIVTYVMTARYKFYTKTQDASQLNKINDDLNAYWKLYNDPNSGLQKQIDFYTCRFLYDLWQKDVFSADQKQKFKDLCKTALNVGEAMDFTNTDLQNKTAREPEVAQVIAGKTIEFDKNINTENYKQGFYRYSILASEFAIKYLWSTKYPKEAADLADPTNLQKAKILFGKALQIYASKNSDRKLIPTADSASIVAISALDLYKATNDKKYLDFANKFISNFERKRKMTTGGFTSYLQLLDEVSVLTGKNYQTIKNSILSYYVKNLYDSGIGAFNVNSPEVVLFDLKENILMAMALI